MTDRALQAPREARSCRAEQAKGCGHWSPILLCPRNGDRTSHLAQREPRSLQPEQMGQLTVSTPAVRQPVNAWILWEDGVEELLQSQSIARTKLAVGIRFGVPPHQHEVWAWAGAVEGA